MKIVLALMLMFSPVVAMANCTVTYITVGGKTMVCTTCCIGNVCNTRCN